MSHSKGWEYARLGPICEKIGSGFTPLGGEQVYQTEGVALIRSQNVYNGSFTLENLAFLNDELAEQLKGVTVQSGDVLLNITGDSVARCCQVPDSILPARVNQHVVIIRPRNEELNARFLSYYLVSPFMQSYMLSLAGSGGTRKALTKEMIERFEIPKPPMSIQQKITTILSAYDSLIDNNLRRMALLEESVRLLYREWVVRLRFPGHEHTRIVNGVPKGWKKGRVGDLVSVQSGFAFKSHDWQIEGNPVIKIANIDDNKIDVDNCQCVSDKVAEKASRFLLKEGDFLIAMTGATVGKVGIMPRMNQRYYLNQRVGIFRPRCGFDPAPFLFVFFNTETAKQQIFNFAQGAAQPNISPGQIESIEIPIPSDALFSTFLEINEPLFQQRLVLLEQNQKLKAARDLLLPRLMSGEIAM